MSEPSILRDNEAVPRLRLSIRLLLRWGEHRGRRLAVFFPSVCYLAVPVVVLLDSAMRHLTQGTAMDRSHVLAILALVGIGLVGGSINAHALWRTTSKEVPARFGRVLALILPLTLALWLALVVLVTSFFEGFFTAASVLVGALFILAYANFTATAAMWPSYRQYAPLFHHPSETTRGTERWP